MARAMEALHTVRVCISKTKCGETNTCYVVQML